MQWRKEKQLACQKLQKQQLQINNKEIFDIVTSCSSL